MLAATTRITARGATHAAFAPAAVRQQRHVPAAVFQQRRDYHENIVEHYENPRNVGSLDKNDEHVGTVSVASGQL